MENTINATATATEIATATATEIAIFEQGVGEGAAKVLANRDTERERAILSMGRRTGASGVRAGIRTMVREDFATVAKATRADVCSRALAILRGA